jgi:hypothetical protein
VELKKRNKKMENITMGESKTTTLAVSTQTKARLEKFRDYPRETNEEIIKKLIEIVELLDGNEANCEIKKEILEKLEQRKREAFGGKVISTKELLDRLKNK